MLERAFGTRMWWRCAHRPHPCGCFL